ncbi:MAG: DNA mismatch repair protein MutS [Alphaproteobacteria bacterium GWC2_42_16]|nr:MAG: DNA mismatch repair protein MutS [Alphaproteobacteria bacterium GWC2_42_16]OFW73320.1 MAG: DNA mismatch repair protein MutS [Alphaproteobacteria bacterium GWA2_41_27]OFW81786.1 MAG: DNA mismatch repair protein MutS [Alphaproteobacteria bacterium RIFCSPHIGHO2_12_FULL_42_100]OFW85695.1 MAG: DNA mismatch repair protein MutS [Alphaproteobacteria bacterium RBG_16_42_14]OFW90812.1 MAG: DNA mismatch repair protein MutS [Alphaproteobacteria bacterium RIFCSPHIGHO2_02_FULL_42_30]OFW92433.1 MAG: 
MAQAAFKESKPLTALTPMMAQYLEIKSHYLDALLFYRMGDFYEMFFEDAILASKALDIALTKRGKGKEGEDVPMCGVPVHASNTYLARLIRQGFRVAICEQLEDPDSRQTKGPLKRDVIRLITPGTLTEEGLLEASQNNFLTCLVPSKTGLIGLASLDISTGDFFVESTPLSHLETVLARLRPGELLLPDSFLKTPELYETFQELKKKITPLPSSRFDDQNGLERLKELYGVEALDAYGEFKPQEIAASGALIDYIRLTQKQDIPSLKPPKRLKEGGRLELDAATRRNLELHASLGGEKRGSLLDVIDHTTTPMGARLLSHHLAAPLTHLKDIQKRLDCVDFFFENPQVNKALRVVLTHCPDLERPLARLTWGRGGPRDLAALNRGLSLLPDIKKIFEEQRVPESLRGIVKRLGSYDDLTNRLTQALKDELPHLAREGGIIRPGYHPPLDELLALRNNSQEALRALQERYSMETGISSLKIKHNNIIGYHVEVTSLHKDKLGPAFIHRQTMANAMRFSTTELAELEQKIMGALDQALAIELRLFQDLVNEVVARASNIIETAHALAALDVAASHAFLATEKNYVKPALDETLAFDIIGGRHPVVEALLPQEIPFIPNDCRLNGLWLLTGPNMAGKSTFLRQNALIALMAHMGMYVPAQKAHIGIMDRIFSRVGASDDLARGRSTFMVEMTETATILNQATPRSFIILDEIGRGTATFDGLSIAWACVEHLVHVNQARSLFATHYHELTALETSEDEVNCYTVKIREWEDQIIFLHEIVKGTADKSYGIHVGKLAGLPPSVVKRAEEVLRTLEETKPKLASKALPLFMEAHSAPSPLTKAIEVLNPDDFSPKEALDHLYVLKKLLKEKK